MREGGDNLERIAKFVLKHRKLVLFFFLSVTAVSVFLMPFVQVNYNLADYVPSDAPSTKAMYEMEREFDQSIPNAQVYIPDVSIPQALEYKDNMRDDANVLDVIWLDDVIDLRQPLAMQDQQTVDGYYQDGGALFQVTVDEDDYTASLASLRDLVGPDAAISGQVVDQANARAAVNSEMATIIIIAVPLALIILTLSTHSWLEPLLLLLAIGVAVALNMGTNIIFGEVSYITQSIAAVLQLAVSMDYAIFMLHRFNQYRQEGYGTVEAMEKAMTKAFSSITSSAMTTIFGFLALVFMRFQLGPDMGLVLAKGVIFSLISVMFLLPIVTVSIYKWIDKTTHRPFLPNFTKLGKAVVKIRWILLALVILVVIPSYLAQSHNAFFYGMGAYEENSRELLDRQTIEEKFGNNMQMAILVPNDSRAKEKELDQRLKNLPDVKSVISLTGMAGAEIPIDILPREQVRQLRSDQYSLFIVIADSLAEGDHAFELASELRSQVEAVYPQGAHLAGENFSTLDMRDTIRKDNRLVNGLAIVAVGLVLLITFRSVALALILLLTIEASIWINLSIPYFQGTNLSFIGFLVISTVQLGATIDYGILFSQHYMDNRKLFGKITSAQRAYAESVPALLPPALILTMVGFILGIVSSLDVVSELGIVLGRGALLSLLLVTTFLPALLLLLDPIVERTTWKPEFHKK